MKVRISKAKLMDALEDKSSPNAAPDGYRWIKGHYLWPDFIEVEGEVVEDGCCLECAVDDERVPPGVRYCGRPNCPCICHKKEEKEYVTVYEVYHGDEKPKEKRCCEECAPHGHPGKVGTPWCGKMGYCPCHKNKYICQCPDCEPHQEIEKLKVGDKVEKIKGYSFPSTVVAVFQTTKGETRIVAEMDNYGLLHIFSPENLRIV